MVKAEVSIDLEGFDHKPSATLQYKNYTNKFGKPKSEVLVLGSRVGTNTEEVTPLTLGRKLSNGQTWSPFVFKKCPDWGRPRRIEPLFKSCQVLAVDFDAGQTEQEIMDEAKALGLDFNILHHSFSSTEEKPKFRGILFLDQLLTDFEQTKKYNILLAHAFKKADKSCVDAARLYFGSTENSVAYLNKEYLLEVSHLNSMLHLVPSSSLLTNSKLNEFKPEESEWGDSAVQRRILNDLPQKKRNYVKTKALGILKTISEFDGSDNSRYQCLWKGASRLARMPELVGSAVYEWTCEAVEKNPHFAEWDKDYKEVILSAIRWSASHCDEPV